MMMSRSETGRRRRNGNLGVWRKTIRNCFTIHLEEKKKHKKTNQPTKPNKKNKNKTNQKLTQLQINNDHIRNNASHGSQSVQWRQKKDPGPLARRAAPLADGSSTAWLRRKPRFRPT